LAIAINDTGIGMSPQDIPKALAPFGQIESAVSRKHEYLKTHVRKGASIGANATIVCGNEIGEYAFIGAGTVITKPVPAYALIVGNPGKQIGWMSEYGHRLHFDQQGFASCKESGEKYIFENNIVRKINN